MPDISMCLGDGCPLKDDCYRFTAVPDMYQSYFTVAPHENGRCADFVPPPKRITDLEAMEHLVKIFEITTPPPKPNNPLSKQGAQLTKEPWRDNYRTPQYILDAVAECFPNGYHDPFDYGLDATAVDWANYDGLPLYCNPPFSRYLEMVERVSVAPVPQIWIMNHDSSTRAFKLLMAKSRMICLLEKRVQFTHPLTGKPDKNQSKSQTIFLVMKSYDHDVVCGFYEGFKPLGTLLEKA